MRVLQYNIYCGGVSQSGEDRVPRLRRWLGAKAYDVVGLNELNGWHEAGIQRFAGECGCPGAALVAGSEYAVGVIARKPLEVIGKHTVGFHHGVLHVKVDHVHFVITHLTPHSAADRVDEAGHLLAITRGITEPLFLMGDLNTLSPRDRAAHEEARLPQRLNATERLRRKFLNADGAVDYTPMQMMLDAGLVDTCARGEPTVPTSLVEDEMHATDMRLDYILANGAALALSPSASVISDLETRSLSDHYPVECYFDSISFSPRSASQ